MGHEGHTVLVVDDNQDIRDLVLHILNADGFHTFAAANASEAMGILNNNSIELVLLDVMMPGKSGLELLSDIRTGSNKKIHEVPVVMITAKSSIEDIDQALALGADSYIVKPFRSVLIREKVRSFFDIKVGE